jgi:hypothetical protein
MILKQGDSRIVFNPINPFRRVILFPKVLLKVLLMVKI